MGKYDFETVLMDDILQYPLRGFLRPSAGEGAGVLQGLQLFAKVVFEVLEVDVDTE